MWLLRGFCRGASSIRREHRGGERRQLCLYRSPVVGHAWLAWWARGVWSGAAAGYCVWELALAAAQRVGLDKVDELTLEAPLILPERGAIQLQVLVGMLEESKRRSLSVYARSCGGQRGRLDAACQRDIERGGERFGSRVAGMAAGWGGGN